MGLPPELRLHIYHHLFSGPNDRERAKHVHCCTRAFEQYGLNGHISDRTCCDCADRDLSKGVRYLNRVTYVETSTLLHQYAESALCYLRIAPTAAPRVAIFGRCKKIGRQSVYEQLTTLSSRAMFVVPIA